MANFTFSEKFYNRGLAKSKRTKKDEVRQTIKSCQHGYLGRVKRHGKREPSLPRITIQDTSSKAE